MNKLLLSVIATSLLITGCSVKKVEYAPCEDCNASSVIPSSLEISEIVLEDDLSTTVVVGNWRVNVDICYAMLLDPSIDCLKSKGTIASITHKPKQ